MKVTAPIYKISLLIALLCSAMSSYAVITIDSAATTPSHCANDGTITIYAHSGSSLLFSIISGPDIRPIQSGSQFGGLSQGIYQVMVTNFSNDTAYAVAIVDGNYVFPDFAPTFTNPHCPSSFTGMIIGQPTAGTGLLPYHWTLTNTNTGAAVTQPGDTFYNLQAGDYSVRMFDSCQGFATRFVTLTDPGNTLSVDNYIYNNMIACDTAVSTITLYPVNGFWATPFIVTSYLGGQMHTDTFDPPLTSQNQIYFIYDTMGGVFYGAGGAVYVTNGCGQQAFVSNYLDQWGPQATFSATTDSCVPRVQAGYSLSVNYFSRTNFRAPITFLLWDVTAGGTRVDSNVLIYNTAAYYPTYTLEPNHQYHMRVYDECGNLTDRYYTTPIPDTTRIYIDKNVDACLDSTGTINLHAYNYAFATTTMTILSGPPITRSSKPYFAHNDSLTYPATAFMKDHCSGYSANEVCYGIGGLAPGIYRYMIQDSCGHSHNDTFVIRNDDLSTYNYSHRITRGCPGQNKISYVIHRSRNNTYQNYMRLRRLGATATLDSIVSDSTTFANLNAGSYILEHEMNSYHNYDQINPTLPCNIIRDTVIVPVYQIPRIDYATQIKCNGTVNVALQPDSLRGVPPYNYEVLSGPQTWPSQQSQFFTFTQPGTYVARISDTCGFAQAFTFRVDTLSFAQIVKVGSSCTGNSAMLISQHSPYATYIWQRPAGTRYTGDTLRIALVTPADYGVYHIIKIVSVNNCRDTFRTTYTLTGNNVSNNFASICAGQSVVFSGVTYTQAGIYYDTIHTPFCDSIVMLTIAIDAHIDSVLQNICTGQSVTVGAHVYNTTGIYRDTFATAGCDSIHILNLNVSTTKRDTIIRSLCAGQTTIFGTHVYHSTGFYSDTFSTAGCDSISILDLRIGTAKTDSVSQSICTGQSVIVGTHMYTTSGIYRDTFATAGCDSIYILNLQITNSKTDSVSQSICAGQSIAVGTHLYNVAGIYRDTFSTVGCDSIHILNLQITNSKTDSVSQSICAGKSITVGTHIYNTAGIYRDTFATTGCDSIHILNLQIIIGKTDSVSQSICTGQSITVGTHVYSATGIYRDTFATPACDSIYILNLQVGNSKTVSFSQSICAGQSVTVGTHVYNITGIYRDTFSTVGCDSIHVLTLQVGGFTRDSVALSICAGQSVIVGTHTYSATGIYRDTFATAGCDSIHILNLSTHGSARDTIDVAFCEGGSVAIGGGVYSVAGYYSDTFATGSCDSIHTIHVRTYASPDLRISASMTEGIQGDTIHLSATGTQLATYSWTANGTLSDAHSAAPTLTLTQSTWATVVATTVNNCTASDSLFITVKTCEPTIYVPNAFTPNGDGVNDKYRVFGRCMHLTGMQIYNRWGEKVWEAHDIGDTWDGTYQGSQQPTEVYVFWATYTGLGADSGERKMTGSITLIR